MRNPGFKNILIPVDFSTNTEIAVKHAIELADTSYCRIHLVHVIEKPSFLSSVLHKTTPAFSLNYSAIQMEKLCQWKKSIEETIPFADVRLHVLNGPLYKFIIDLCHNLKPQLIIVAKRNNYRYFSFSKPFYPNVLAKVTNYPVLTVMQSSIKSKVKVIAIPVRSFIPKRKIELAINLATLYSARIQLIGLSSRNNRTNESKALFDTIHLLQSKIPNTIDYTTLNSNNFAKDAFLYAAKIDACIMLVNPWVETQISIFTNKHINDIISSSSKLKILSLEPYPY